MRGQRLVQGRCNGKVVYRARTAAVCANGSINHHYSTEPPKCLQVKNYLEHVVHIKNVFDSKLPQLEDSQNTFRSSRPMNKYNRHQLVSFIAVVKWKTGREIDSS